MNKSVLTIVLVLATAILIATAQGPGGPLNDLVSISQPAPGFVMPSKPCATFRLTSPVVADQGAYPVEFTGDGAGVTPPIAWRGAPPGTKSYALIMHHVDREGKTKIYWILYNISAAVTHLEKNSQGIGVLGLNTIKNRAGYAPPHSKGPGPKTYVITLYALSDAPTIQVPPDSVNAKTLVNAMKDRILATADLHVIYSREGAAPGDRPAPLPEDRPRPQ